jgi:hypothetical protein
MLAQTSLQIEDSISGQFSRAESRVHLHPGIQLEELVVERAGEVVAVLKLPQGQRVRLMFDAGPVRHEQTTWHPEFGRSEPNVCLVKAFNGASARTRISWSSAG